MLNMFIEIDTAYGKQFDIIPIMKPMWLYCYNWTFNIIDLLKPFSQICADGCLEIMIMIPMSTKNPSRK